MFAVTKDQFHSLKTALATLLAVQVGMAFISSAKEAGFAEQSVPQQSAAIPWSEVGARAGADYHGDGLSVTATPNGARLRCLFQRLEGQATPEGLWLASTVTNSATERFRVMGCAVGRTDCDTEVLAPTGTVSIIGQKVQFTRRGVTEEYSVSMDGVRQDFVVVQRPAGMGELQVQLSVSGAQVEASPGGARLILNGSERKIAYNRLRVTDATGREVPARIEVPPVGANQESKIKNPKSEIAVLVDDAQAVYPVRVDPTFSDANWVSIGGLPGANGEVDAVAVDDAGNLYIGGNFSQVGGTNANSVAKWNGSNWIPLGSGIMNGNVYALAVAGTNLYAGGYFFMAGGSPASEFAKWNGSTWSGLSSGVGEIHALVVAGSDVYAGGYNGIAKWDGNNWLALGSGIGGLYHQVYALALLDGNVYVGGQFTMAGGIPANSIAKWNGTNWSRLGSGVSSPLGPRVFALAVSGSDLFVGGDFSGAGGNPANYIAKWNGTGWSALGSGLNGIVDALAVSGIDVYAGGRFTTAGGTAATNIAKWKGNSWTNLGSGINGSVYTLAVSGSDLYAGGWFATAGGKPSAWVAHAYLERPTVSVRRSGGALALSWPVFYSAFVLEQNPDVGNTGSWSTPNYSLTTNGATKSVTVPSTAAHEFFRLIGN